MFEVLNIWSITITRTKFGLWSCQDQLAILAHISLRPAMWYRKVLGKKACGLALYISKNVDVPGGAIK